VLFQAVAHQPLRLAVERILVGQSQVLELSALDAPDVIVPPAGDFKAGRLAADLVLPHMALVSKPAEIAVDRAQADRWDAASGLGKHLVSCRMVVTPLDDPIDQTALAAPVGCPANCRHRFALFPNSKNENGSYS